MRYIQINSVPNGSTGSIMMKRHYELLKQGVDSYVSWGRRRDAENERELNFGSNLGFIFDVLQTIFDGKAGFHSKGATKRLLKRLDEINPDVVHLHNVHGYYLNVEMLFEWLAKSRCQVQWTLHDCWAFTGHCAYFSYAECEQWKHHCSHESPCPQLSTYPITLSERSCAWNFAKKRDIFTSLPKDRMMLITPSKWLATLVAESFLSKYPLRIEHNTIDLNVFKPTPSDFRKKYDLENKFIILGVASPWSERKGLKDFVKLAKELDDNYVVVLVGLNKKQIRELPRNIIKLERVDSSLELAKLYSVANIFFNPTYEENYPTVNLEAEACGTPVITYDAGGSGETICSGLSKVIPVGSVKAAVCDMRERGFDR